MDTISFSRLSVVPDNMSTTHGRFFMQLRTPGIKGIASLACAMNAAFSFTFITNTCLSPVGDHAASTRMVPTQQRNQRQHITQQRSIQHVRVGDERAKRVA
mgnify:CR=1 FL=1